MLPDVCTGLPPGGSNPSAIPVCKCLRSDQAQVPDQVQPTTSANRFFSSTQSVGLLEQLIGLIEALHGLCGTTGVGPESRWLFIACSRNAPLIRCMVITSPGIVGRPSSCSARWIVIVCCKASKEAPRCVCGSDAQSGGSLNVGARVLRLSPPKGSSNIPAATITRAELGSPTGQDGLGKTSPGRPGSMRRVDPPRGSYGPKCHERSIAMPRRGSDCLGNDCRA